MRASLMTMAALALALGAPACSSSPSGPTTTGTSSGGRAATGGMALLPAGQRCSANAACASGVCGVDGNGNCCAQPCSTSNQTCGANSCDDTGACSYPSSVITCPSSCTDAGASQNTCNGAGACVPVSTVPCPGHFGCDATGDSCNSLCTSTADCAPGFACNGGACLAPSSIGACTENDDCTSGHCGVIGFGHCCADVCGSTTLACAAPDCAADSGACLYPTTTMACGSVTQSCTGSTQTNASHCDAAGNCATPKTTDCSPYLCGGDACLASCGDGGGCVSGDFCDSTASTCCGINAGGAIAVDAVNGSDLGACCGIGTHGACQTISHAMKLIDDARQRDVTITATVKGSGGDWSAAGETYPIILGWGAELVAPGVYFMDPGSGGAVFSIGNVSESDTIGYASIAGTTGKPIWIGMNLEGAQSTDRVVIQVQPSSTLYLANASLNGSASNTSTAIDVAAGATLMLGGDRSSANTGTVTIGLPVQTFALKGYEGIVCGAGKGLGCIIKDVPLKGIPSLVIQGQEFMDLDLEDFGSITLTSAPVIGVAPKSVGFQNCPFKADEQAVLLNGKVSLTFDNGTVQCISNAGFYLQETANGAPSLNLDGTTIQNTELGVYAGAGTATLTNSTIRYNVTGVEQSGTGLVDLSGSGASDGGADGGTNTVACSSQVEGSVFQQAPPGVSVLNTSTNVLNANNVSWDTSAPDLFTCNGLLKNCACAITTCAVSPGSDGMDGVDESSGSITTTGNQLSTLDCTPP